MTHRFRLVGVIAFVFALMTVMSATLLADSKASFSATTGGLVQLDPGISTQKIDGTTLKVTTKGEVNQITLACFADPVCVALGLDGATLTDTHDSKFELDMLTGALEGKLKGTFATSSGLTGTLKAGISGLAGPSAACGGGLAIGVTDEGQWKANEVKAKGTFSLSISGCLGVFLTGGGEFGGEIKVKD